MFSISSRSRVHQKDVAEKPFWISYADLMTALMVLFLVVMCVALLAVTKTVTDREREEAQHKRDIEEMLRRFEKVANREEFKGIKIDKQLRIIDFGTRAQFPFGKSSLTKEQERLLRAFVPAILAQSNDELGRRVLKRIVVEGFTDKTGTYLSNLDLSLQRSQRVLCALFDKPAASEIPMSLSELEQIRALFLVGGYSFNASKQSDSESRRIEMRLEFLGVKEQRPSTDAIVGEHFGTCALKS